MKQYFSLSWLLLAVLGLSIFVSGCKKEGCTDPAALNYSIDAKDDDGSCEYAASNVKLNIQSMWGTDNFTYGTTYALTDGRNIKLDIARFYISEISLTSAAGETKIDGGYAQFIPTVSEYTLGNIAPGNYTGISFTIGVDSANNTIDPSLWPADHTLSSSSATFDHWSWSSGYVFMKVEGQVDASAGMNEAVDDAFIHHVGSLPFARTVSFTTDITVSQGGDGLVNLKVDLMKFFDGLDMMADLDTHTMNNMPLAMDVANNVQGAVSLQP